MWLYEDDRLLSMNYSSGSYYKKLMKVTVLAVLTMILCEHAGDCCFTGLHHTHCWGRRWKQFQHQHNEVDDDDYVDDDDNDDETETENDDDDADADADDDDDDNVDG